jgi:MFS family permease
MLRHTSDRYRMLGIMTAAQAGASVVQQAIGSLAPLLLVTFALNAKQLGVLFTALYLGSATFTAVSGVLTDRLGERRMLAISGSIMTLSLLGAAAFENYVWLVGCIFVFAIGYAPVMPAGGRAILAWFKRDRGFAMGIRQTGVPVGGLLGAIVLPLAASHFDGYRGALVTAAVLVGLPSLLACVFYREPTLERQAPATSTQVFAGMKMLFRDPRLIATTITCSLLMNTQVAMNGFLTVTAIRHLHVAPGVANTALAGGFIAAGVARIFWGWFSDRAIPGKRIELLAGLSALSALSTSLFALLPVGQAWLVIPSAALIGLFGAGWNGVMAAALAEIGGPERAASAVGLTLTFVFGLSAVGPLIFGAIADHASLQVAWFVTSAFALAGVLPAFWLQSVRRAVPAPGTG